MVADLSKRLPEASARRCLPHGDNQCQQRIQVEACCALLLASQL
jgi:hypothetical protein